MRLLAQAAAICLLAAPAWSQGIGDITVTKSGLEATIELPAGIEADLTITFEEVVGLYQTGCEIGLNAATVDPADFALLGRLPDPAVGIPAAFPVLISIEPPIDEPFTFTGVAMISLHTHNLAYTMNSPLRLFAADQGGEFYDITYTMGMGSYRVGGSKGKFSEFLIVADLRPVSEVIEAKFDRLQTVLDDNAGDIDASVLATLQSHVDAAWSWYTAGDLLSAKDEIESLIDAVQANSGHAIPPIWRSSRDLVNVAGELRERAATLRFSLSLAVSS